MWLAKLQERELEFDDPWQMAVELDELLTFRIHRCELRYLIANHLLLHQVEVTQPGQQERQFASGGYALFANSCFIVAPGFHISKLEEEANSTILEPDSGSSISIPKWIADEGVLFCGESVAKVFRVRAENQRMILDAFEEEHWCPRIDDPLPPSNQIDAKRRLHNCVVGLNRNQKKQADQISWRRNRRRNYLGTQQYLEEFLSCHKRCYHKNTECLLQRRLAPLVSRQLRAHCFVSAKGRL